jgi:Rrf2 family protein
MQISKKTQYGLRAMVYLASQKSGEFFSLKDISEKENISFDFLEKIMGELEKNNLIKSKKGASGGYSLVKKPAKITAKDIVQVLENTNSVDCTLCGKSKHCASKNVWRKIDTAIEKTLSSIKLSSLAK